MNESVSQWTPLFVAIPFLVMAVIYIASRSKFGRPIRSIIRVICVAVLTAAWSGVIGCLMFLFDAFNPASPQYVAVFLVAGLFGGLLFQLVLYFCRRAAERDDS